ncbi:MAG: hypothetical protein JNK25_05135 [Phycisphaerae bacterium]|nr:hypothetical protein [Phycisphaerae bacterium]
MNSRHTTVINLSSAATLLLLSLIGGCATPARPTSGEALKTSPPGAPTTLDGEYDITFHSLWAGPMRTRMKAQPTPGGFKANTPPGVAWNLVGGVQGALGPLLAPYLFPQGMLLVWESTSPDPAAGRDGEGWIGISTIGPFRARTRTPAKGGPTRIELPDGRLLAAMRVSPTSDEIPRADFASIVQNMERIAEEHPWEPPRRAADLQAYFSDVRGSLPHVTDDVSFAFACGLAWRKHSGLAVPAAFRGADDDSGREVRALGGTLSPINVTRENATGIATIEILSLLDVRSIDDAVSEALSPPPRALIIDLRNAGISNLSALRLVSHLSDRPLDAGCFIRAVIEDRGKAVGSASSVPLAAPDDYSQASEVLKRQGGVRVSIEPHPHAFKGPVAVLVTGRTRSVVEVAARVLAESGRAAVVGQRTAGKPRLHAEHAVGWGYIVRTPEFIWLPVAGPTIDKGLAPTLQVSADKAPVAAARLLIDAAHEAP